MAELSELHAHLEDLLPVLRALSSAAAHLVDALPQTGAPDAELDRALAEVNSAIDDYCTVTLDHSGLLDLAP